MQSIGPLLAGVSTSPGITGVLTSCGRHDLLVDTLHSFYRHNTLPLDQMIIVEDGAEIPSEEIRAPFSAHPIEWIATGENVGQLAAIDYAYSRVKTPYIFHLEDDWEFFREGFIEKSLAILRAEPKCLQVWIRPLNDMNDHPVLPHEFCTSGVQWRKLAYGHYGVWHGFSFNPGLRRLRDYVAINGYGCHARFNIKYPSRAEEVISSLYRQRDFFAAAISDAGGRGFVRHSGDNHHIGGLYGVRRPPNPARRAIGRLVRMGRAVLTR